MADDIRQEHQSLLQLLYAAPVGLVQIDADGTVRLMNGLAAGLLMPLSRDGRLDNLYHLLEGVAPDLYHLASTGQQATICDGRLLQLYQTPNGPCDITLSLSRIDGGELIAVLHDVSEQVRQERELRQTEAWFNATLSAICDHAVLQVDAQGRISEWHQRTGHLTGHTREQVLGKPFTLFYPPNAITPDRMLDRIAEADRAGWSLDEGWRLRADGSRFWGSTMLVPMRSAPAEVESDQSQARHDYCLILRDISDQHEQHENRRHAINSDHLTGLANRRAFFEAAMLEMERWHRAPRPLALLMLDIDHFKQVNDRHGHPAGDAVLRHVAGLLAQEFRRIDIVARIGGEEFAVLLPSTDLAAASIAANRLRLAVAASPAQTDSGPIVCTLSGGLAMMSAETATLEALIKQADMALYAAKVGGRNRIMCAQADQTASADMPQVRTLSP
ncbi:MAG: diguanylate cyclase [Leptothrix sp. (in: b-proteobacteria)]